MGDESTASVQVESGALGRDDNRSRHDYLVDWSEYFLNILSGLSFLAAGW